MTCASGRFGSNYDTYNRIEVQKLCLVSDAWPQAKLAIALQSAHCSRLKTKTLKNDHENLHQSSLSINGIRFHSLQFHRAHLLITQRSLWLFYYDSLYCVDGRTQNSSLFSRFVSHQPYGIDSAVQEARPKEEAGNYINLYTVRA